LGKLLSSDRPKKVVRENKNNITFKFWFTVCLMKHTWHKNENDDKGDCFFYVGYISKIKKSSIFFSAIDADGIWYDDIEIIYSKITSVTFCDRYSTTWQKYLSK
jgi:hypothetical protein